MKKICDLQYGGSLNLASITEIHVDRDGQRDPRPRQIAGFEKKYGFRGQFLGMIYITPDGHIIEGQNRWEWLCSMTVDGKYVKEHTSVIPKGKKPGDECLVECVVITEDPVEAFIALNDTDRVKAIQAFKVCVNAPKGYEKEKALVTTFQKHGIDIQYNTKRVTKSNTTKNAHDLLHMFKKKPSTVSMALGTLSKIYRHPEDSGVYEKAALTRVFMVALVNTIHRSDISIDKIRTALKIAWQAGLTADTILQLKQCSGTGPKTTYVASVLQKILEVYVDGGNMNEVYGFIPKV